MKELAENMVFIVNDLLYCVNFGSLRNWRNVILLAGIYYSTKLTLKTVGGLYSGFKTFCLPLVLARDYKSDYGPWAGKRILDNLKNPSKDFKKLVLFCKAGK